MYLSQNASNLCIALLNDIILVGLVGAVSFVCESCQNMSTLSPMCHNNNIHGCVKGDYEYIPDTLFVTFSQNLATPAMYQCLPTLGHCDL